MACNPCAAGDVVGPEREFELAGPAASGVYYIPDIPSPPPAGEAYGVGTLTFFADPVRLPPLMDREQILRASFTFSGGDHTGECRVVPRPVLMPCADPEPSS